MKKVTKIFAWSVAFQSSSSSYTFIPSYSVSYYYEYGD